MSYKIVYGYAKTGREKARKFTTLEAAAKAAQDIFAKTGIIVGVEKLCGGK